MPFLQIRDVPEETRRQLKAKAASLGLTLEKFCLAILRDYLKQTKDK